MWCYLTLYTCCHVQGKHVRVCMYSGEMTEVLLSLQHTHLYVYKVCSLLVMVVKSELLNGFIELAVYGLCTSTFLYLPGQSGALLASRAGMIAAEKSLSLCPWILLVFMCSCPVIVLRFCIWSLREIFV